MRHTPSAGAYRSGTGQQNQTLSAPEGLVALSILGSAGVPAGADAGAPGRLPACTCGVLACQAQGLIQHSLRPFVLRAQPQRFAKFGDCLRVAPVSRQRHAEIQMRVRQLGRETHGLGEFAESVCLPPNSSQRVASESPNATGVEPDLTCRNLPGIWSTMYRLADVMVVRGFCLLLVALLLTGLYSSPAATDVRQCTHVQDFGAGADYEVLRVEQGAFASVLPSTGRDEAAIRGSDFSSGFNIISGQDMATSDSRTQHRVVFSGRGRSRSSIRFGHTVR